MGPNTLTWDVPLATPVGTSFDITSGTAFDFFAAELTNNAAIPGTSFIWFERTFYGGSGSGYPSEAFMFSVAAPAVDFHGATITRFELRIDQLSATVGPTSYSLTALATVNVYGVIPAPGAASLSLLALGTLLIRRRRS